MFGRSNKQVYKTVLAVWISLSFGSMILAGANWLRLSRELEVAIRSTAIQESLNAVMKSLLDAETAQRGYVISGSSNFLRPLEDAETRLPVEFDRLLELSRNDSTLLKAVTELRALAEVVMAYQRRTVKNRREQGESVSGDLVRNGEGKTAMDAARKKVFEIQSSQTSFASPGHEAPGRLLQASLTSLIAGSIGICAGVFAAYLARVTFKQEVRERQLLEATLRAEHDSREKSAFVANMSHEIRTPMNAILGFSELLSAELRDQKQRQYVHSIRTSATGLLHLINDILDLSKIDAGALELHLDPTDPREICHFLNTVFYEPAAKKGIHMDCRVAENLPRALLLDRTRIRQLLVNLVGNAVKFTDHGHILTTITWEKQQQNSSQIVLIIQVEDTGVGIPKDKLDAVFKPFVQAGIHQDKDEMGTGLGLSIVQRLTRLMGGTITVASVVGQGSAFHLRFPNVAVSARLPVSDTTDPLGPVNFDELKPAKILVVDDNKMNCQLLAGMFEDTEHTLEYGANGIDAVQKTASFRPQVLLLDIRMPQMDGCQAVEEIRKMNGFELLPIIAVTASSLIDEEKHLRKLFNGYIRKPFTRRELFNELAVFLPKRDAPSATADEPQPAVTQQKVRAAGAWRDLTAQLRTLEVQEWPTLRDTLAVNHSRQFGEKLEGLGREHGCEELRAYGRTLAHHAQTYAVDALEQHLQNFPALLDRVESADHEA